MLSFGCWSYLSTFSNIENQPVGPQHQATVLVSNASIFRIQESTRRPNSELIKYAIQHDFVS